MLSLLTTQSAIQNIQYTVYNAHYLTTSPLFSLSLCHSSLLITRESTSECYSLACIAPCLPPSLPLCFSSLLLRSSSLPMPFLLLHQCIVTNLPLHCRLKYHKLYNRPLDRMFPHVSGVTTRRLVFQEALEQLGDHTSDDTRIVTST